MHVVYIAYMASGISVPNCAACQNPYKYGGPTPYLLPCLHSVCENCLQSDVDDSVFCTTCNEYFIKIQNNFPKSCHECLSNADACAACSECSQTELTHINPFQRDVVTAKTTFLSTAEHFASELLCTNRDDGNQAMSWCEKCEAFLCEHCQASHENMKITRSHAVVPVTDLKETDIDNKHGQSHCSVHEGHPTEYFDEKCKIMICYKCTKTVHKDCTSVDLAEKLETIKERVLGQTVQSLAKRMKHNTETEHKLRHIDTDLTAKKLELDGIVKHTFEELKVRLQQREEEVKIQLRRCFDDQKEHVSKRLGILESDKRKCDTALQFHQNCLKLTSPGDVLDVENAMNASILSCLSKELPHARNQEAFIYFSRENLKGLQEDIAGFGGFYTRLKDVASHTLEKEHVTISKTVLADLREKEDVLQKQVASLQEKITLQQETLWTERLQGAVPKELTLIFIDSSNTRPDTEVKLSYFILDQQKANRAKVFFTDENKMQRRSVNLDLKSEKFGEKEISTFTGTTSTKSLTSIYSEYWEVHANVNLHQVLTGNKVIMETGICIEKDIDVKFKTGREPGSVVLYVTHCETHKRICVRARKGADWSKCYQQPLSNTTDTNGKLTNPQKNQCIFIDLNSERIMCSFENAVFDTVFWPVFAVFHRSYATVELSCVSGDKIQMDKTKRDLILSALS